MWVQTNDRPGQLERMREALSIVAETKNSERLHEFLATGRDRESYPIDWLT